MKKYILFFLPCLFFIFCSGCHLQTKSNQQLFEKNFIYFDTVISLQFYAGENGNDLMEHCVEMCAEYENTFSRTLETSELYAINHRTQNTVTVSDDIAELISVGLQYYTISNGKFDITIAPLSDLWDFKSENASVPEADAISEALKKVGADQISLSVIVTRLLNCVKCRRNICDQILFIFKSQADTDQFCRNSCFF